MGRPLPPDHLRVSSKHRKARLIAEASKRRRRGQTYAQIADALGTDPGTIHRWINPESRRKKNQQMKAQRVSASPLTPQERESRREDARRWIARRAQLGAEAEERMRHQREQR